MSVEDTSQLFDGRGSEVSSSQARYELLSGKTENLPAKRSNIFRIFLSSTFTDMALERNTLMSSVFPELKKYCKDKYNYEFQVVDMRWGVQDQASDDHSTSELCMNEIRNCQQESGGPTFVCFLGDRYGSRFLRKYIPTDHWTLLAKYIDDQDITSLLSTWYKVDGNSSPPRCVLQSISSIPDGGSEWKKHSESLYQAVKEAAIKARTAGDMTEDTAQIYIRSVTEEEIEESGMFNEDSPYRHSILACSRSLDNINYSHNKAWRFIDQDNQKNTDTEARALLAKLKDRVKRSLPTERQLEYRVDWSDDGGMNESDHSSYLKQFSEEFKAKLTDMIDKSMANQSAVSQVIHEDSVSQEAVTHLQQAVSKCVNVIPRSDILDKIKDYVCGTSTSPFVVYGHSGCGKTSSMALSSLKLAEWLGQSTTHLILRFLGTTPASSEFELMLRHLRAQIYSLANPSATVSQVKSEYLYSRVKDTETLVEEFQSTITSLGTTNSTRFVIMLDSIDQLRENKIAFDLSWLPLELPSNVKLIISTLPDLHNILQFARSLPIPDTNFVEVQALDEKTAWSIIDFWLRDQRKTLTDSHRESVSSVLHGRKLTPLYVKLIYDIISTWKSYTPVTSLPANVSSCLEQLFTQLESVHGELQVRHALGYITCCPGGVSQVELEDILSLDDVYLTTVYQYHIPPVRRIPPLLWVRIRSDISDYLVEKESDGVSVINWYHRQFIEYAQKRFIDSSEEKSSYYTDILKEYFEGKWASREKPFTYNDRQMKKLGVSDPNSQALRYVNSQSTRSGVETYNLRKVYVLNALYTWPQYLPQSDKQRMAEMAAANLSKILMDLEFFTARFVYGSFGVDDLMKLLKAVKEVCRVTGELQFKDCSALERFYFESRYILSKVQTYYGTILQHPTCLPSYLFYYMKSKVNTSPLVPPRGSQYPSLSWLLSDILIGSASDGPICPLVSTSNPMGSSSQNPIIVCRELDRAHHLCTYKDGDGNNIICSPSYGHLVILKITSTLVTEVCDITLSTAARYARYIPPDSSGEAFILAANSEFALVSLKTMRQIPSKSAERMTIHIPFLAFPLQIITTNWCIVLRNPWLTGKDSIFIFAGFHEVAFIFSYKADDIIWYRYTNRCKIRYISVSDTEQAHVKHLVVTITGMTEIYKLELHKDGSATVTLNQTVANSFHRQLMKADPEAWTSMRSPSATDDVKIHIPEIESRHIAVTTKNSCDLNGWKFYPITRRLEFLPAGELKLGMQLLVALSDQNFAELYSISVPNLIMKFSARFQYLNEFSVDLHIFKANFAHVAPSSNILGLYGGSQLHLYYIEELDDMKLKVTPVWNVSLESKNIKDIKLDCHGYAVYNSAENQTIVRDLTATEINDGQREYLKSSSSISYVMMLPESYHIALVLQEDVHMWSMETNEWLGKLARPEESASLNVQAQACTIHPIESEKGGFYVAVNFLNLVAVYKVNLKRRPVLTELVQEIKDVDDDSGLELEVIPYPTALLACEKEKGLLQIWRSTDVDQVDTIWLKADADSTDDFETVGFYPWEYCYTEDFLLIYGKHDDFDETAVLIFDCNDEFKLIKTVGENDEANQRVPCSFIYIKCLKTVIGYGDQGFLWKFDCKTREVQESNCVKYKRISCFDNYDRIYQPFLVKDEPEIHLFVNGSTLIRLDVRRFADWSTGGGIEEYEWSTFSQLDNISISFNSNYIIASKHFSSEIALYKLYSDKPVRRVSLLGRYALPTPVSKLFISFDEKYALACLESGEIHCMKILDKEREDFQSDTEAFLSRFPPIPSEMKTIDLQDQIDTDTRWASMKEFDSLLKVPRSESHLENWAKSMISDKESYPVIGSKEFISENGEFTPLISSEPLSEEENQRLHEEGMKYYETTLEYQSLSTVPSTSMHKIRETNTTRAACKEESEEVDKKYEIEEEHEQDESVRQYATGINESNGQPPPLKNHSLQSEREASDQAAPPTRAQSVQSLSDDLPDERRAAPVEDVTDHLSSNKSKTCVLL